MIDIWAKGFFPDASFASGYALARDNNSNHNSNNYSNSDMNNDNSNSNSHNNNFNSNNKQ